MSDLVCKGSFALGSACGTCSRCREQIEEYNAAQQLREKLDGTGGLKARVAALTARAEAAEAKLEKAHAALTPFVDFYAAALEGFTETWEQRHFDNHIVLGWNNASLTKGAFTQARDAIKELDA